MVGRKVLSLWIVLPRLITSQKQCFRPSGIAVTDTAYQPCIQIEGVESMCCRLNDTNPDICHSNGLCMATQPGDNLGYWRDFCTDSTWKSPNCLQNICPNEGDDWTAHLQPCDQGNRTYCCGSDDSCCNDDGTFSLEPTLVSIGTSATKTATPTCNIEASPSSATNVAIGAGVGVPLGVLSIAMLGTGFWWGKKKTDAKYTRYQGNIPLQEGHANSNMFPTQGAGSKPVYEMQGLGTTQHAELPVERG